MIPAEKLFSDSIVYAVGAVSISRPKFIMLKSAL